MSIRSQHRTAPTGIRDDRLGGHESSDILSRQLTRAVEIAGVRVQRAATNLVFRRVYLKTIRAQHALRRTVNASKKTLTDAAREQRYDLTATIGVSVAASSLEYRTGTIEQRERKLRAR